MNFNNLGPSNEYKINEIYNSSRFEWRIKFEEIISEEIKIINKMFKNDNLTEININLYYSKKQEKYILECNRLRGGGADIFVEMFEKLKKIFNDNN